MNNFRGKTARFSVVLLILGGLSVGLPTGAQNPPGPDAVKPAEPGKSRTLTLNVPEKHDYLVRILPSSDAKKPAQLPSSFTGPKGTVTFDPAEVGSSPRIAVDDTETGNTALFAPTAPTTPPGPKAAAGEITVNGDTVELRKVHFDHVHRVEAVLSYENKRLQNAVASLKSSDGKSVDKVVSPAEQGVAVFEDVPAGKATLTLKYGNNLTETRDVDILTDHDGKKIVVQAVVMNKAPTLETPATENVTPAAAPALPAGSPASPVPGAPGAAPAPADSGNWFTSLLSTILGLAAAAGIIYALYRWAQSGGMAATLKKAGIEVAGTPPPSDAGTPWQPQGSAPPVVSDPSLCQFCGQKKDAAGNCACTLSGAALNTGPTSPVIPNQPRLVATMGVYSGTIFPLNINGAGVTLGREATNSIPLGNDTTVSRRHAAIRQENGTYLVSDEGSSNGVYLNGVKISGSQPIRPGDEVQIGNTRFRFEL